MKYYLTGLLFREGFVQLGAVPCPEMPLWNILKPFLSAFCPLLEDWALNHHQGLLFFS